jgi:hypothetical protein
MSDNPDKLKGRGRKDFYVNIFQLSETDDPDALYKEWKFIEEYEHPERDGDCICGSIHLKRAFRFFNRTTGHVIQTGEVCAKKLRLQTKNKETNRFMITFFSLGYITQFCKILDVYEYSVGKRKEWMESILKDGTTDLYKKSLKEIQTLLGDLREFHSILHKNGVTDLYLNRAIRMVEKREGEIIMYKQKREAAERMVQEAKEKKRNEEAKEREENGGFTLQELKQREEAQRKREEYEQEVRQREEAQRKREEYEQQEKKEREAQEREGETRRREAYDKAFEEKAKAEATAKCNCGTLLKQLCHCKHPVFTQRTLFGDILCSRCKGKHCKCN